MLKIVYLGTPEFAVTPLKELLKSNYNIVAVVTQPDREKNRKGQMLFTPVKSCAIENGLKVFQFEKIRNDGVEALKKLDADLFITCAYGQILSQEILDIPKLGTYNIHASLLPKYRGSSPVQWSLINGEEQTGITIMRTDIGVDTGDIILENALKIEQNENAGELLQRLSALGATSILQALNLLQKGEITFTKQNEAIATHFPMVRKTDGKLDFTKSALELHNKIRGLNPNPGCYTFLDNTMIKVHRAEVIENKTIKTNIGEVIISDLKNGLHIACGKGVLRLKEIQLAGGKKMPDTELLKGRMILTGSILMPKL